MCDFGFWLFDLGVERVGVVGLGFYGFQGFSLSRHAVLGFWVLVFGFWLLVKVCFDFAILILVWCEFEFDDLIRFRWLWLE